MIRRIRIGEKANSVTYLKEFNDGPVLWRISEPIDTREIIAHAAGVLPSDLEIVQLPPAQADGDSREYALLTRITIDRVQEWYLQHGLYPFSGARIMWGNRNVLMLRGYPVHAKQHPAAQVNIERALDAFRAETKIKREETDAEELQVKQEELQIKEEELQLKNENHSRGASAKKRKMG